MQFGRTPPSGQRSMPRLVLIIVSAALALPTLGAAAPGTTSFAFGRTGGNIAPFTVTISNSGAISASGAVKPKATTVGPAARARLAGLLTKTRFTRLPPTTRCRGTLPDIAANFITVSSAGKSHTVLVHGDCSTRFTALYNALAKTVGIPT